MGVWGTAIMEGGEVSDTESDETIVEGSVVESDLEEKELRAKRFSLVDKDLVLARETSITSELANTYGEKLSPNIPFNSIKFHIQKQLGLFNLPYQEINEKEESQSLLPIELSNAVNATNIGQFDCVSAATVHGEYKCIGLESKMPRVPEMSHQNDDSLEESLLSNMNVVKPFSNDVPKYPETSMAFQSVEMISGKSDAADNGQFHEAIASNETINSMATEMFGVKHVIKPLDEFVTNQMSDTLEYQNNNFSIDTTVNEESNTLPEELLTALNALTESIVAVEDRTGSSTTEKQLTPEQTDDDATEIIETDLKSHSQCHEEPEALMIAKMSCTSGEHIDYEQCMHRLCHPDPQKIDCSDRPSKKGKCSLKDIHSCEHLFEGTSYTLKKSDHQRKSVIINYIDATSECQPFLEGTHQRMHRFNDKENESLQLGICTYHCSSSDVNTKIEQVRKSQRIAKKTRKQTIFNCYSNDSSGNYISLSVINRRDGFGQTLLHRAATEDDLDGVCAMIKAGANVNAQDYAGWTPLHESSLAGCFEISNELLKAGADVNCKGYEQVTPLHDAVKEGHYKVAELLLWYGADPLFKNERGKNALEEATDKHMRKLVESYIDHSGKRSKSENLEICYKMAKEKENYTSDVPFQSVALKTVQTKYNGNCQYVDLGSGSKVKNVSSSYTQFSQIEEQQIPQILDSSQPRKKTKTITSHLKSTTTTTINKRNAKGETHLHLACKKGNFSLVKSLIASGACVNQKDNAGWTPIHEASNRGFTEIIAELLKSGADVNSKSLDGVLPIHDAVSGNHFEAVQLLLLHGANPNERNNNGENALDEATCDQIKELLKSYGATEVKETVLMAHDAGKKELRRSRLRRKSICYGCQEKEDLVLQSSLAGQKYTTHELINKALLDIENKQERLLLFELKYQRDADLYIQHFSEIQDSLNTILVRQKSERDELAKKYRASVESFKQGVLREKLVNLAARQKNLLLMARKQKELWEKIQNFKNAKKEALTLADQVPDTLDSYENTNTKNRISGETVPCPNIIMDHESIWRMENSSLNQDHPNIFQDTSGENGEINSQKKDGLQLLVFENNVKKYNTTEVTNLESSDATDSATLLLNSVICSTQQLKEIDCILVIPQETQNLSATSTTGSDNNICQPSSDNQNVCMNMLLSQHSNMNNAFSIQPIVELESTCDFVSTDQDNMAPSKSILLNVNLESPGPFSQVKSQNMISQKTSQYLKNQDSEKDLHFKKNRKKKNQLLNLLELGKIKPGDDVLEFTLQDSKHKASLLGNGKVQTGCNSVYQNPVQWIKAILGNDICVSWKYVYNKVTYCGRPLSTIVNEMHVPTEQEVLLQQKNLLNSSCQANSSKTPCFLQFNKIMLITDEEFLPWHAGEEYWNFYVKCENFGF
ncbi:ankyrin repeat domain-containing protein 31 [Pituophis catenifer annectens]|uniref:ankyrin repeat domain-containing protein 31 n=1 Tax=Pituophis catenifer annectens TaxID=94852 RepID=UPI0039933AC6